MLIGPAISNTSDQQAAECICLVELLLMAVAVRKEKFPCPHAKVSCMHSQSPWPIPCLSNIACKCEKIQKWSGICTQTHCLHVSLQWSRKLERQSIVPVSCCGFKMQCRTKSPTLFRFQHFGLSVTLARSHLVPSVCVCFTWDVCCNWWRWLCSWSRRVSAAVSLTWRWAWVSSFGKERFKGDVVAGPWAYWWCSMDDRWCVAGGAVHFNRAQCSECCIRAWWIHNWHLRGVSFCCSCMVILSLASFSGGFDR